MSESRRLRQLSSSFSGEPLSPKCRNLYCSSLYRSLSSWLSRRRSKCFYILPQSYYTYKTQFHNLKYIRTIAHFMKLVTVLLFSSSNPAQFREFMAPCSQNLNVGQGQRPSHTPKQLKVSLPNKSLIMCLMKVVWISIAYNNKLHSSFSTFSLRTNSTRILLELVIVTSTTSFFYKELTLL